VLVDLAVRSLMDEYGLSREGALRFLQREASHHELGLRDAALTVVAPGSGRDPSAPRRDLAEDLEDFRLMAPAELDQPLEAVAAPETYPSTTTTKGRPA
jgi:hypothetical protein